MLQPHAPFHRFFAFPLGIMMTGLAKQYQAILVYGLVLWRSVWASYPGSMTI
jgi:hypothetical protein